MPDTTIRALYDALHRHDGVAAAACYAPTAVFTDPAFGTLAPGEVRDMWTMLTARSEDLAVELGDHGADGDRGHAHWTARYTFGQTGNVVVNEIDSVMRFEGELIVEQTDSFDLRRWAAQALGTPGRLLGFTPLLGPAVRRRAHAGLDAFQRG